MPKCPEPEPWRSGDVVDRGYQRCLRVFLIPSSENSQVNYKIIPNKFRLVQVTPAPYDIVHLLLGIGNDLLGDDGVGPFVAQELEGTDWTTIDAGIVPENFIRPIRNKKPDTIVIVDAVEMGCKTGTIRIIPLEYIRDCGVGTHQLPLTFLAEQMASWSKVIIIGIQPGTLDPDTPLSESVKRAATELIAHLKAHTYDQLHVLGSDNQKEED